MAINRQVACFVLTCACASANADEGVSFETTLIRGNKVVATPLMVGHFGQPMSVEISRTMRLEASADAPNAAGQAMTAVKLFLFVEGEMRPVREMSMLADLSSTPSFQYSVPNTDAKFTVKPRRVELPK